VTARSILSPLALTFDEVVAMEEGCDVIVLRLVDDALRPESFGHLRECKPRKNAHVRAVRKQLTYTCVRSTYTSSELVTMHDAEHIGLLPCDPYMWDRMDDENLALNGVTRSSGVYWSNICVVRRSDAHEVIGCSVEELEVALGQIEQDDPTH
jgi:hypothetical protein